ncbi:hypothetical protein OIU78_011861 [Salix suchowensis]|nr:hypothetical protein OIU78_011861 [Salix suchowensis]
MALRAAVLHHIRVPVQTLRLKTNPCAPSGAIRLLSSHDDHLTKEEVVDRVVSVIKSFPKVDPSRVRPNSHSIPFQFGLPFQFQWAFFFC